MSQSVHCTNPQSLSLGLSCWVSSNEMQALMVANKWQARITTSDSHPHAVHTVTFIQL